MQALHNCVIHVKLKTLLQRKELFYPLLVNLLEDCEMIQVSLLLLGLLCENVAVISVLSLDLSRSGKREALFGTGVGLILCHFFCC